MIKVTIGTTTERFEEIVEETATPKEVLENSDVIWETANIHIDGAQVTPEEMNNSFEELGIKESCRIIAVVKTNNA